MASKDSKKMVKRNEKGQLLPGSVLNEKGKTVGTVDFKTRWLRFIDFIATQEKTTPEEIEKRMDKVAYEQMQDGKFPYWKDVNDRLYGQAKQALDLTGDFSIKWEQ